MSGTGSWKLSWLERSLYYIVNNMAADNRVTQGARESAALILTLFSQNTLI